MQWHPGVGKIEGLPALACLGVDRSPGRDDRAEIRDRVVDPEAAADTFEEHCLVEVPGTGRVDRHKWDVGGVLDIRGLEGGDLLGLGLGIVGEVVSVDIRREIELGADGVEAIGSRVADIGAHEEKR